MYGKTTLAYKYFRYLLTASNGKGHGIHSPFVFDFVTRVLRNRAHPDVFDRIEAYRRSLKASDELLEVEDFGAGSAFGTTTKRSLSGIARNAAKSPRFGRLLYQLAAHYSCKHVLELGTSLGISTAYLASAPGVVRVITLEGAPAIAAKAREGFMHLGLTHIEQRIGNFDDTLAGALQQMPHPDLIFVDGNHREEPTLRYFHQCLAAASEDTILVFDDIHWSAEMESAWRQIKAHPTVRCSIDLFTVGILFLRTGFREKQDFVVRVWR